MQKEVRIYVLTSFFIVHFTGILRFYAACNQCLDDLEVFKILYRFNALESHILPYFSAYATSWIAHYLNRFHAHLLPVKKK
jgi:hypothetical protein